MSLAIEQDEAALLDALQICIPLVERPFAAIGEKLGMTEAEVIERVSALKTGSKRVIRQVSAIFDSSSLGYHSTLVAAKVDPAIIERAADIISAHPGVSHNYQRGHDYNLWYTLTVPPDSRLGLQRTLELLHRASGARITRLMPALKMYKIGVKFDMGESSAPAEQSTYRPGQRFEPSCVDKQIIRALQRDLPLVPRPFDRWAAQSGVPVTNLLWSAQSYLDRRIMRRFSAVLHHRQAGFSANAMGAWIIDEDKRDAFGAAAAKWPAVSHCYQRPTFEDWPYSIFTMVHGRSKEACEAVLADISAQTGFTNYAALYSTHEFKKVRVKYFTPEIEAWENSVLGD